MKIAKYISLSLSAFLVLANATTARAQVPTQQSLQQMPIAQAWQDAAKGIVRNKWEKIETYVKQSGELAKNNKKIPKHTYTQPPTTLRIATYNVHYWNHPDDRKGQNLDAILNVIQSIQADIIVLQEVNKLPNHFTKLDPNATIKTTADLLAKLQSFGYQYGNFDNAFCKGSVFYSADFGNLILSKYPFAQAPSIKTFAAKSSKKSEGGGIEERCYINAVVKVGDKEFSLYGTHLEEGDDAIRLDQIKELVAVAQADEHENVAILADFNAVRKKDFVFKIGNTAGWDLFVADSATRKATPTTAVIDWIESNGFMDSFSFGGFAAPRWTVWSGTAVDFIFLKNSWNLPLSGSYVWYSAASDHLPVIMDVQLVEPTKKESKSMLDRWREFFRRGRRNQPPGGQWPEFEGEKKMGQ